MSELTLSVVAVFSLLALFEHFWSEEGIVNLASEDGEGPGRLPKVWALGMLSFASSIWVAAYLDSFGFYAMVSLVAVVSLMADLTNTTDRWERRTGYATVLSILASAFLMRLTFGSPSVITVLYTALGVFLYLLGVALILFYLTIRLLRIHDESAADSDLEDRVDTVSRPW